MLYKAGVGVGLLIVFVAATCLLGRVPQSAGQVESGVVQARHGMVVSVSAPGTDAGVAVLKEGGNAVDPAGATAFALAATYPPACNIRSRRSPLPYSGRGARLPATHQPRPRPPGPHP